ncbi:DNA-directed RNA polymerase [Segatella salivae]|nr:DNA-directed RNA polymerase [Segatella salivae]MBW4906833.1 DNA-directed RNA polymerase [Segatella salivae]
MSNIANRATIQLFQRCKRCTFDSPGLPNDSAGYPGLAYVVWGTTP